MWPDRVSKPVPLAYESDVLPTVLCGPVSSVFVSVWNAKSCSL